MIGIVDQDMMDVLLVIIIHFVFAFHQINVL